MYRIDVQINAGWNVPSIEHISKRFHLRVREMTILLITSVYRLVKKGYESKATSTAASLYDEYGPRTLFFYST